MNASVRKLFDLNLLHSYKRPSPLILVNGLAEQSESWFANRVHWSRHFDVKVPEILVYDGDSLHQRIDDGGEITVDYLTDRLATYLDEFVQRPPYHLVGSSLGGQIILTYAVAAPGEGRQARLALPLGLSRRREPADDGGGPAEPVRHAGQVGLPPRPLRQRRADRGDRAEVPEPASGRRASCGPSAAPSATRSRRC